MTAKVIVIGGGYGGVTVAAALDDVADVVLVEPRENFVHNVAALRAVVDPEWVDKIFLPYGGLLRRGSVRQDRAVRVTSRSVELFGGDVLAADYIVLATGSSYPSPAKPGEPAPLHDVHRELAKADRVLLVGAGPVGLEFAGEIKAAWPSKQVIVVDRSDTLMPGGYPAEFHTSLRTQLDELGIELRLGTTVSGLPEPGRYAPFAEADIWFPCYGGGTDTGYLDASLGRHRRADGRLEVTPSLRLPGVESVFAVGDVTALPEQKMARLAGMHGEVVAANIRALIGGGELSAYEPQADAILLPLGPRAGVGYAPEWGLLDAETTAGIKAGFRLEEQRAQLGVG